MARTSKHASPGSSDGHIAGIRRDGVALEKNSAMAVALKDLSVGEAAVG
jgi:hypothetical protein